MSRPHPALVRLVVAAALLLGAGPAAAHSLSRSYARWTLEDTEVRVALTLPVLELARMRSALAGQSPALLAADPEAVVWIRALAHDRVGLVDADAGCAPSGETTRVDPAGPTTLTVSWTLRCARAPRPAVRSDLFFSTAPSHVHHVTVRVGKARHEALLTGQRRVVDFAATDADGHATSHGSPGFGAAVALGMEHVASGLDHIAFVIALLLLGGPLLHLLGVSAGFTIGHSVTLALAALGVVGMRGAGIEVLVGLSIAYAALSCFHAWAPPGRRRRIVALNLAVHAALVVFDLTVGSPLPWPAALASALATSCHLALHRGQGPANHLRAALAFLFGLVHGFAFAGAVGDLFQGSALVVLLLGFNVGVELAQAVVLLATVALFAAVARLAGSGISDRLRVLAAASVLAYGVSLTLARALGAPA